MGKKSINPILFVLGLALLAMGCQISEQLISFSLTEPPVTDRPHSTFVPPRERIQVDLEQILQVESYHTSKDQLGTLEIFVNGQPIRSEKTSGSKGTFPHNLASVAVLIEGQPVITNAIQSQQPIPAWTVSIQWVGHVPGTYDLSMVVTDQAGHPGEPIVQRIEVK